MNVAFSREDRNDLFQAGPAYVPAGEDSVLRKSNTEIYEDKLFFGRTFISYEQSKIIFH